MIQPSCSPLTIHHAMLTETDLPEKLYLSESKEQPKVLGGIKIGNRKLTVITGASSGLGLNCANTLTKTGRHFVVMAVRDVDKGKRVAKEMNFPDGSYVVMKLELGSLQSVRDFVFNLKAFKSARPIDNLICNAAVYKPTDPEPKWTDDGFEQSMGINHFGHFLLVNLLVDDLAKAKGSRCCIVGSITGNTNTVGEWIRREHLASYVFCWLFCLGFVWEVFSMIIVLLDWENIFGSQLKLLVQS